MPKLPGSKIPPSVGPSQQRIAVRDDEIAVGCALVKPCGWRTIRPLHAAHSAQWAHTILHKRGLL